MPIRTRPPTSHRPAPSTRRSTALVLLGAGTLALVVACATSDESTHEQQERRQVAIARYDRCLDRRISQLASTELGVRRVADCTGHRRDVLKTYPAHREAQVARLLDERAARRSGVPLSTAADATARPIIERLMELISGE